MNTYIHGAERDNTCSICKRCEMKINITCVYNKQGYLQKYGLYGDFIKIEQLTNEAFQSSDIFQ